MTELEAQFDQAMMGIYYAAKAEANYTASLFIQMLHNNRGVATALTLIRSPKPSEGFTALWERGRLDLTVEALIAENPQYHSLFTSDDIQRAYSRLKKYGYKGKGGLNNRLNSFFS